MNKRNKLKEQKRLEALENNKMNIWTFRDIIIDNRDSELVFAVLSELNKTEKMKLIEENKYPINLEHFIFDEDEVVRISAAETTRDPGFIFLIKDYIESSLIVMSALALNKFSNKAIIDKLLKDKDFKIVFDEAMKAPYTPELLKSLPTAKFPIKNIKEIEAFKQKHKDDDLALVYTKNFVKIYESAGKNIIFGLDLFSIIFDEVVDKCLFPMLKNIPEENRMNNESVTVLFDTVLHMNEYQKKAQEEKGSFDKITTHVLCCHAISSEKHLNFHIFTNKEWFRKSTEKSIEKFKRLENVECLGKSILGKFDGDDVDAIIKCKVEHKLSTINVVIEGTIYIYKIPAWLEKENAKNIYNIVISGNQKASVIFTEKTGDVELDFIVQEYHEQLTPKNIDKYTYFVERESVEDDTDYEHGYFYIVNRYRVTDEMFDHKSLNRKD